MIAILYKISYKLPSKPLNLKTIKALKRTIQAFKN